MFRIASSTQDLPLFPPPLLRVSDQPNGVGWCTWLLSLLLASADLLPLSILLIHCVHPYMCIRIMHPHYVHPYMCIGIMCQFFVM